MLYSDLRIKAVLLKVCTQVCEGLVINYGVGGYKTVRGGGGGVTIM